MGFFSSLACHLFDPYDCCSVCESMRGEGNDITVWHDDVTKWRVWLKITFASTSVKMHTWVVRATLCTTLWNRTTLCTTDLHCAPPSCVVHHGKQGGLMFVRSGGHSWHFSFFGGSQGTCKKKQRFLSVDTEHANQGSQWSSVLTYTLVVHSVALYRLGGTQDDFACLLWITREMVHNTMLWFSVHTHYCSLTYISLVQRDA